MKAIPFRVKLAYGSAEFSVSIVFTTISIFFLFFLTEVVGISPAAGSMVLSVAVLWDAFSDPIMGIVSDRTPGRYGRRRPYILASAVPYGVIFWLLFVVPPLRGNMLIAYYMFVALLMHTAMTILDVPYTAMAAEMTRDYDERTSLVSYRVICGSVGTLLVASVFYYAVEQFDDPKTGWSVASSVVGLICLFPILYMWHGTRGWEHQAGDAEPLTVRDVSEAVFRNRTFRYVLGLFLFSISAVYASGTMAMYFLEYLMQFTEGQISVYWFVLFLMMALWVPVITFLANRIGKRGAFILLMAVWAAGFGVGAMLVRPGMTVMMYLLAILASIGGIATYQLGWAMIADVVEVDEFKTGRRREGLYYGVCNFAMKLGSALALFLVGQLLELIGYEPGMVQSASTILGLRVIFGPLLASIIIVSIVIAYFMPMTRAKHKALIEAIEAKRAAQSWNEEAIKDLL